MSQREVTQRTAGAGNDIPRIKQTNKEKREEEENRRRIKTVRLLEEE